MTAARARKSSPILGAAGATIGEASISLVSAASEFSHSFEVEIDRVRPDPDQPRRHFDAAALAALGETLRSDGQLQPVLLRPDPQARGGWILVAGERRWRAAKLIGWTKLLAISHPGDPEIASLLENLQRVDLTPIEEARGINRLLTEKGWTQEQAARALGRATSDISGTLRILSLPEALLAQILTSEHPPAKNVLIELARIDDPAALARLAMLAREGGLTVKAIRAARGEARAAGAERGDAATGPVHAEAPREGVLIRALRLVAAMAAGDRGISQADAELLRSLHEATEVALRRSPRG
jgi:ParB family chromosome partitioning protein